jgi:hypothetical protein
MRDMAVEGIARSIGDGLNAAHQVATYGGKSEAYEFLVGWLLSLLDEIERPTGELNN